ncbi:hypothetical protein BK137_18280 [Viridibacillus arenosi]|nr:hypothetical protein BK137_18280 [Viridibacillus arenosi]
MEVDRLVILLIRLLLINQSKNKLYVMTIDIPIRAIIIEKSWVLMGKNINKELLDEHTKKSRELIDLAKAELELIDNKQLIELEKVREVKIKLQQEITEIEKEIF